MSRVKGSVSRSVLSALEILGSFDGASAPQSLSEISRRLKIPKATAHRILAALEAAEFVVRDEPTRMYRLGLRIWELAARNFAQPNLIQSARPVLVALAARAEETSLLAVLADVDVVYLDMVDAPQRIRAYFRVGERLPAYGVGSGKAILAYSDAAVVQRVIADGFRHRTRRTIRSRRQLLDELKATRERGYSVALGEWYDEVGAIAAPVFEHGGTVIAALGVSGPLSRLESRVGTLGPVVRRYADQLSSVLGWRAPAQPSPSPAARRSPPATAALLRKAWSPAVRR